MKKTITLALAFLLLFSTFVVSAAPEISYDGTSVIVKGTVENANAENPVAIIIVNPAADGSERELSEIEGANSTEAYNGILEYVGITTLDDALSFGSEGYKINLKDGLKSGICAVYMSYMGENELVKIDSFKHINADELESLVKSFNSEDADYSLILTDSNLDLLSNIGVDKESYENISEKTAFHGILKTFAPFEEGKPNKNMSAVLNFSTSFSEALALQELAESDDTLSALAKYNTKYWSVDIDEDDDFSLLGSDTKASILTAIKTAVKSGKITRGKGIANEFTALTGLAVLKDNVVVKGDAEDFILKYYEVFGLDKDAYLDGGLSDYDRADICSYIIENKDGVLEYDDVLSLYNDALDSLEEEDEDDSSSNRVSSGGGGSYRPPVVEVTEESEKEQIKPLSFNDVAITHWAYEYVSRLYNIGVVAGKDEKTFSPDASITKEEFIKLVVSALKLDISKKTSDFADVTVDAWYAPYVTAAVNAGLISGKSDGTFGIGDTLSRQDAAVILSRALASKSDTEVAFADKGDIAPYALDSIAVMNASGIINGYTDGTFKPMNSISRAESCAVLCRLLDKKGGAK